MSSQPFAFVAFRYFRYGVHIGRCAAVGAIVTGLSFSSMLVALANPLTSTNTTKLTFLQSGMQNHSVRALGTPVSTNLDTYRESCKNPQDVLQITALCVSLGVLTGENPDGSVELADLTEDEPITQPSLRLEDVTSAPRSVPPGSISLEQNDKVQLFPRL
jgi:hypothetical protein